MLGFFQVYSKKDKVLNSVMKDQKKSELFGEVSGVRHKNMSRIRGKDTSIELALRKALWAKGYRYRKNYRALPGSPDIALTKYRIAIFCDGEFFHGKDWEEQKKRLEKGNNAGYWIRKIERNMERDTEKDQMLRFAGWTVIHFWGKEILADPDVCIRVIEETIFENMMSEATS